MSDIGISPFGLEEWDKERKERVEGLSEVIQDIGDISSESADLLAEAFDAAYSAQDGREDR